MDEAVVNQAREIITQHPHSVFVTVDDRGRPVDRVMWAARVDDDLTVYYATALDSAKIGRIKANPNILAIWFGGGRYVSLRGVAEVTTDRAILDGLWRDSFVRYFPGGKTDPNYAAIKITPHHVNCQDQCEVGVDVFDLP